MPACRILFILFTCLTASSVLSLVEASAQSQSGEDVPLGFIKADRYVIRGQVELSVTYAEQALSSLENAAVVEDIQRALEFANQSYRLMRYAVHGLELLTARQPKFAADPVLEMAINTINDARSFAIPAQIALNNSIAESAISGPEIQTAIRGWQQAVTRARSALYLL